MKCSQKVLIFPFFCFSNLFRHILIHETLNTELKSFNINSYLNILALFTRILDIKNFQFLQKYSTFIDYNIHVHNKSKSIINR